MPSLYCAVGVAGTGDPTLDNRDLTHTTYEFKGDTVEILNAPDDSDWSRWGMLDDRKSARLYVFRQGSNEILYQFIRDNQGYRYDANYPGLNVTDIPDKADVSHIGQLSTPNFEQINGVNGKPLPVPNNYHVYMLEKPEYQADAKKLHQFIWARGTEKLESNGITSDMFNILPFPDDAEVDWRRWSMNYDSNRYQLALRAYVFSVFENGSTTRLHQARYDNLEDPEKTQTEYPEIGDATAAYQYSGTAELVNAPDGLNYDNFATVFDGVRTTFYFMKQ